MKVKNESNLNYCNYSMENAKTLFECYYKMPRELLGTISKMARGSIKKEDINNVSIFIKSEALFTKFANYIKALSDMGAISEAEHLLMSDVIEENATGDFILDFIPFSIWVEKNYPKVAKQLNNYECKIAVGIFANFNNEQIKRCFKLSGKYKEDAMIEAAKKKILKKFGVKNYGQMMLRSILAKPYLWSLESFDKVALNLANLEE